MIEKLPYDLSSTSALFLSAVCIIATYLLFRALFTGPPGPWGLPLLGYYPFIGAKFHLDLAELAKKYGEVFVFNYAGQGYVHLNSLKAIKEAHVKQVDCFTVRPQAYSVPNIVFGNGAGFINGDKWRVMRKFLVQSMRHFGVGGNHEEFKGPVLDSVTETLEELKKNDGQLVDLIVLLTKTCTSAVHKIFLGDIVSEEYAVQVSESYESTIGGFAGNNILLSGNFAKYFIMPWRKEIRTMKSKKKVLNAMLQRIIDDHRSSFDVENPRDVIDFYLREKKLREDKKDPQASYFTDDVLVNTLVQVYGDGSFGVAFFIATFLRELSFRQDVQKRIHEEIIEAVGSSERLPTWEDRERLPYTMATIKELIRTSTFFPANPSLECTKDTTVLGVPISKGQVTIVNMYSVHHDPTLFKDPYRFDPTRFLNDSSLSTVAFGIGKRACAGESMVILETFAYIASICQRFHLTTDEDVSNRVVVTSVDEAGHCKVKVSLRKPQTL